MRPPGASVAAWLIPALTGSYLLLASATYLFPPLLPYDGKRLLQLILFALVFAISLFSAGLRSAVQSRFSTMPVSIKRLLALIFALGLSSSFINSNTAMGLAYSLMDVYLLLAMLAMILILAACRYLAGDGFDGLAMASLAAVGVAVSMQELMGLALASLEGSTFSYEIELTHFAHPRFFNQFQTWAIPVLTAFPLVFHRKRWAGPACLLLLGLNWYILMMSGGRGSTAAIVISLAVTLLFFQASRRHILKWQGGGLALGLIMYLSMIAFSPGTAEPAAGYAEAGAHQAADTIAVQDEGLAGTDRDHLPEPGFQRSLLRRNAFHTTGRSSRLWPAAWGHFVDHPVLGLGPMNFACKGPQGREGHPHNFPLQLLSEWGLLATLSILALCVVVGRRAVLALRRLGSGADRPEEVLPIMLACSMLAAALHAGLSGILIMPVSQVAAVLICGWLLGLLTARAPASQGTDNPGLVRLLLITMLMIAVSTLFFAAQELSRMTAYREQLTELNNYQPRLWQAGNTCQLHQGDRMNTDESQDP
jgi:hypothetical protein